MPRLQSDAQLLRRLEILDSVVERHTSELPWLVRARLRSLSRAAVKTLRERRTRLASERERRQSLMAARRGKFFTAGKNA